MLCFAGSACVLENAYYETMYPNLLQKKKMKKKNTVTEEIKTFSTGILSLITI